MKGFVATFVATGVALWVAARFVPGIEIPSASFADLPQDAYAWRDGMLFKTPSTMSADGVGFRLGGATLELGSHPLADELRGLGLPRRALSTTSFLHWRATFDGAQILGKSTVK